MTVFSEADDDAGEIIRVLDSAGFAPYVASAAHVYGAAMVRGPELVVQRRGIITSHLDREGFVAVTAMQKQVLHGFGYGYPGVPGDWWHDVVTGAMSRAAARAWMADVFEVAELHVEPSQQRRGLGRTILQKLLDSSTSQTVVLSTHDRESPARRLYRSFGFVDLLRDFRFPGSTEVYAILGLER